MAPKKDKKMTLAEFVNDKSLGRSWADEMEEFPTAPSQGGPTGYGRRDYDGSDRGFGSFRDRSHGGDRDDRYPPRQQLPLPEKPPYTAHVGNLSWDVTETEISDFFTECNVVNVRLVRDKLEDRPKGFGYVEFGSLEGLIKALELSGSQFSGRPVRVSVAEPPKDRADDRTAGEWRRSGPLPPLEPTRRGGDRGDRFHSASEAGDRPERRSTFREDDGKVRDFNNWERKGPLAPLSPPPATDARPQSGGDRRRSPGDRPEGTPRREFRERPPAPREPTAAESEKDWRSRARAEVPPKPPVSPVIPQTRPKLELKKRSETAPETPITPAEPTPSVTKPSPFGAARPIDTDARLREVEEKRAAAAAAKKEEEERLKAEAKAKAEAEAKAAEEKAEAEAKAAAEAAAEAAAAKEAASKAAAEVASQQASEAAKVEAPKTEAPNVETPKPETPRSQAPKHEGPRDRPSERRSEHHSEQRFSDRRPDRPNERRNDRFNDRNHGEGRYRRQDGPSHKTGPGGGRDWSNVRKGPPPANSYPPRRNDDRKPEDKQQAGKVEASEQPKPDPAEEGWSTVSSRRRGPANGKAVVSS